RIDQVCEEFRLQELLDRRVRKLSSGQKTRVSLAKSLINRPEFLLLDEPTASLDPDTTSWIRDFLKNYRDSLGATILFASHDMREVELLCDEVLLMKKGKLIERGSPQELLNKHNRENLEQVFLDLSREGQG
ncbi:MAG: ABC transporter ATP-binding protein, partial [Verrucomicrobia bacterium]|nr:ABC transporter ATP-binding protein [Verrucomicrobiota bacterium]